MNPMLVTAAIIATLALVFYSLGVLSEQIKTSISRRVVLFLTVGVGCDLASVVLMIIGSRGMVTTFHGVFGYSALAVMAVDTVMIWRYWASNQPTGDGYLGVPKGLHIYTRAAYGWWVTAYVAGAVIGVTMGG